MLWPTRHFRFDPRRDGPEDTEIIAQAEKWFVPESRALGDALIIAADFRIDPARHMHMAICARNDVDPQRIEVLRDD